MPTELRVSRNYPGWITPAEAVKILEPSFGTNSNSYLAKDALLERLRGGKLIAMAGDTNVSDDRGKDQADPFFEIPKSHWVHVDTNSTLWTTSSVTFEQMEGSGFYLRRITVRLYDVRFPPDQVRAMLPLEVVAPAAAPPRRPNQPMTSASLFRRLI
jgi:hypothetical protein